MSNKKPYLIDYNLVVEHLDCPLLMSNQNGDIVYVNDSLCSLFQTQETNIVGNALSQVLPEQYANIFTSYLKCINSNPKNHTELAGWETKLKENFHQTSQYKQIENVTFSQWRFHPIVNNNNAILLKLNQVKTIPISLTLYFCKSCIDANSNTTDDIFLVVQIHNFSEELRRSNMLIEINRELDRFAAIASHDMQEPLRKIETFADLLRDSVEKANISSENIVGSLTRIITSVSKMRNLVNQILNYSKVSQIDKSYKNTNIHSLITEVVLSNNDLFTNSDVNIEVSNVSEDIYLKCNPYMIKQCVWNLIQNSVKYRNPKYPAIINIDIHKVHSKHEEDHVNIVIADNGLGVPKQHLDSIFEPFRRIRTEQYQGSGLGLSICRRIISRHGGIIYATSNDNKGISVYISLPITNQPISNAESQYDENTLPTLGKNFITNYKRKNFYNIQS